VQSVYARETGEGLVFPPEGEAPPPAPPPSSTEGETRPPVSGRPQLKVVK
jgi:stringent starvation protein B